MVMHGGKYVTVGSVLLAKRESAPDDAKVCYHTLADKPRESDPGFFQLALKYHCIFQVADLPAVKKEQPGTEAAGGPSTIIQQGHVASALPWAAWMTQYTAVCWVGKWSPKACSRLARSS